jgi:Rod binding domain-containing protein
VTTDLAITGDGRLGGPGDDPQARLRHAAGQFEAAFVQLLFQASDQSEEEDPPLLGGGAADQQFKELFRSGLSERAAGHLGIADLLVRQLGSPRATPRATPPATPPATPSSQP